MAKSKVTQKDKQGQGLKDLSRVEGVVFGCLLKVGTFNELARLKVGSEESQLWHGLESIGEDVYCQLVDAHSTFVSYIEATGGEV